MCIFYVYCTHVVIILWAPVIYFGGRYTHNISLYHILYILENNKRDPARGSGSEEVISDSLSCSLGKLWVKNVEMKKVLWRENTHDMNQCCSQHDLVSCSVKRRGGGNEHNRWLLWIWSKWYPHEVHISTMGEGVRVFFPVRRIWVPRVHNLCALCAYTINEIIAFVTS